LNESEICAPAPIGEFKLGIGQNKSGISQNKKEIANIKPRTLLTHHFEKSSVEKKGKKQ